MLSDIRNSSQYRSSIAASRYIASVASLALLACSSIAQAQNAGNGYTGAAADRLDRGTVVTEADATSEVSSQPWNLNSAPSAAAGGGGQLAEMGALSPFPIALRLGLMVSPRTKFDGGVDVTIRHLALIPGFDTRVDADAIVSANFGGVNTLVPITFDQIIGKTLPGGIRIYGGGGIGAYISNDTRFGGKLLVGGNFTSRLGAEMDLHFSGFGPALLTLQARIGL